MPVPVPAHPPPPPALRYLVFELSEGDDCITTLDAEAATRGAPAHAAALAEVAQVLAWAEAQFTGLHGPLDEGAQWDHALHVQAAQPAQGDACWATVALTLSARGAVAQALVVALLPQGGD